MINVLFVCHGNICRSPMAEFLFKDYVKKKGLDNKFHIESRATSTEEIGNGVHYGTRKILDRFGIDYREKKAMQITQADYDSYQYIIIMDEYNKYNIERRIKDKDKKIHLLLEYAGINRDISDPWYTHDFETTYKDIMLGIEAFYNYLVQKSVI